MSWWDYGYQITAMANRTILVDNNTWNNTHISRVGQVCNFLVLFLLLPPVLVGSVFLAHLAKGNVSFCHHLASVVR